MSSKAHKRNKRKVTQVFEKGVFRGEHLASRMDKEITSANKSYIRVASVKPKKQLGQ